MISVILFLMTSAGPLENNPVSVWHSSAEVARVGRVYFESSVMGVVYRAENKVNGKCYVGKTVGVMEDRKYQHEWNARNGFGRLFQNALRKHGFDAFEWKVLMIEDNEDDLNESEIACIKMLRTKTPNGYNLTDGGDGISGWHHSDVTKIKIGNASRGVPFSMEHKIKIGNANRGKCLGKKRGSFSTEHKAKISKANTGKKYAVLTNRIVKEARQRARRGETILSISKSMGYSHITLGSAIRGKTWKCVSEPPVK